MVLSIAVDREVCGGCGMERNVGGRRCGVQMVLSVGWGIVGGYSCVSSHVV